MTVSTVPLPTPGADVSRAAYAKEAIWLPKLAAETLNAGLSSIKGKTFTDCLIEGPAVIMALQGVEFDGCYMGRAQGPEELMLIPAGDRITGGVIFVEDCTFLRCNFSQVGFTGDPEFREMFLASMPTPQAST